MNGTQCSAQLLRSITKLPLRPRVCQSCKQKQKNPNHQRLRANLSTSRITRADVQQLEPVKAAAPIDFDSYEVKDKPTDQSPQISGLKLRKLRIVPQSPSYFTGKPISTDNLIALQAVLHRWQRLPVLKPNEAPRVAWLTFEDYKARTGQENVKRKRHGQMVTMLRRLNLILPEMRSQEVVRTINKYSRDIDPSANRAKPILVDEWGRARAVGRRKESSAQVYLVEGEGEVKINGKSLAEAFVRVHDRESVVWALKATDRIDKYNVWGLVSGGGTTGQAEALTLGIAKALVAHEPMLKRHLRKAGCITRDPRRVERKKPGHVKARKMPTWVKR